MEKGLLEKTGKGLNHWKGIVRQSGLEKHGQIVSYLKSEHGFTHGFANFVSLKAREADAASNNPTELIDNQYQGKEHLRPILEKIISTVDQFGSDITKTPKKDSVSLIRKRQFALVKPATKTRVDLGLKLKDKPTTDRLGNSGPFGTMCTHRVQLTDINQIDEELINWLMEAYERAN
ncbi:MAG: phosphoribosylformylglycinamidine synthase [Crocinitomicaceae bacterium]|nr:phosphoribosylformylglycinamidine synthase [Crocinitomicaceae bacterium]|tara:strand:- start:2660 stop:3190 length:531 start_codon:yes stop_codon:yes gene_type:complete